MTTIDKSFHLGLSWAGTAPGNALVYKGNSLFAGYYDENKQFTIASVDLLSGVVTKVTLDSYFEGWDSHRYIAMAVDTWGNLHVSGNMHVSPLIYAFAQGGNLSLLCSPGMVGSRETQVTYPTFLSLNSGLFFLYREGVSGDGAWLANFFNGSWWERIPDIFTDTYNNNTISAYPTFVVGPGAKCYVAWCWRLNGDAATNFDVHYAETDDFRVWRNASGQRINLPLTPDSDTLVESVPTHGGLLNNVKIGFDLVNNPIITYMKYDGDVNYPAPNCAMSPSNVECGNLAQGQTPVDGATQVYNARFESGNWRVYTATSWTARWSFGGTGSLSVPVGFTGVVYDQNKMQIQYFKPMNSQGENGYYALCNINLAPTLSYSIGRTVPLALSAPKLSGPYFTATVKRASLQTRMSSVYWLRYEAQSNLCRDQSPSAQNCPGVNPLPLSNPPPSSIDVYVLSGANTVDSYPA